MKKVLFISLLIFIATAINAQQIDKNELKQLKSFLSQTSHSNKTNAQIIGIKDLKLKKTKICEEIFHYDINTTSIYI